MPLLLESITPTFADKNPNVLKCTCQVLESGVRSTYIDELQEICPQLIETQMPLTTHQDAGVRDAALTTLGVLKGRLGESFMAQHFKDMNPQKMTKVNEGAESVEGSKFDQPKVQKKAPKPKKEEPVAMDVDEPAPPPKKKKKKAAGGPPSSFLKR